MDDSLSEFWHNTWLAWRSEKFSSIFPFVFVKAASAEELDDFVKKRDPTSHSVLSACFSAGPPLPGEFLVFLDELEEPPEMVCTSQRLSLYGKQEGKYQCFNLADIAQLKRRGFFSNGVIVKLKDGAERTFPMVGALTIGYLCFAKLAVELGGSPTGWDLSPAPAQTGSQESRQPQEVTDEAQTVPEAAAAGECEMLASERQRLERELDEPILAIGLFRRVYSAGFGVYLLGAVLAIPAAIVFMGLVAIVSAAVGQKGDTGLGVFVLVASLLLGQVVAAGLLRRAKGVFNDFAAVLTPDRIHFCKWSFGGKPEALTLAPAATSWPRASFSMSTGNLEERPAAMGTSLVRVGFLLDKEPMFQAQVLSVLPKKDGAGAILVDDSKKNDAFKLLRRDMEHRSDTSS